MKKVKKNKLLKNLKKFNLKGKKKNKLLKNLI
jgi:hypothetical protein